MSQQEVSASAWPAPKGRNGRAWRGFALTLLAIEFLDELVDGSRQAAWPLIRLDLQLSYTQIGLLLAVPRFVGNVIESPLGLLGDTRHRRALILAGGVFFTLALLLVAMSYNFASLLMAFIVFSPAGGAFVNLSQAALMDSAPARREQNMARWAFAGSVGVVAGSAALNVAVALGAGWRGWYGAMTVGALLLVVAAGRLPLGIHSAAHGADAQHVSFRASAAGAWASLRRVAVWRWLVLLELADLMLDGFHGFLALYFVDVLGATEARAGLAVAVWSGIGLLGDFLLIPLLERVRGLRYLRWSVGAMLCLFPAFLLAPGLLAKLALLGLIGITNAGWYSILKAQLYAALPGRSGAALALHNVMNFIGALIPFGLGLFAESYGLGAMMWLLLAGPLALLVGIPRSGKMARDVLG